MLTRNASRLLWSISSYRKNPIEAVYHGHSKTWSSSYLYSQHGKFKWSGTTSINIIYILISGSSCTSSMPPTQRRFRSCEGCLPSRVPFLCFTTDRLGLWRLCPRVSPWRLPLLLWAMGLYSSRMHCYGNSFHFNKSQWFWMFHGGTHRKARWVRHICCGSSLPRSGRLCSTTCVYYVNFIFIYI